MLCTFSNTRCELMLSGHWLKKVHCLNACGGIQEILKPTRTFLHTITYAHNLIQTSMTCLSVAEKITRRDWHQRKRFRKKTVKSCWKAGAEGILISTWLYIAGQGRCWSL